MRRFVPSIIFAVFMGFFASGLGLFIGLAIFPPLGMILLFPGGMILGLLGGFLNWWWAVLVIQTIWWGIVFEVMRWLIAILRRKHH